MGLISGNGQLYVAGVNSGPADGVTNPCGWGAEDEYCRLSTHIDWIKEAVNENSDNTKRGLWMTYGGGGDSSSSPNPSPTSSGGSGSDDGYSSDGYTEPPTSSGGSGSDDGYSSDGDSSDV